jgi:CxxC motif-containing protein (DUF1111 family)
MPARALSRAAPLTDSTAEGTARAIAVAVRDGFAALDRAERDALVAFLESL